jgi:hypothetical protein
LNRHKQLDQIIARLAGMDGLVARLALEITHSVRELTVRINDLERELAFGEITRSDTAHPSRHRRAHRGEDPRRDR